MDQCPQLRIKTLKCTQNKTRPSPGFVLPFALWPLPGSPTLPCPCMASPLCPTPKALSRLKDPALLFLLSLNSPHHSLLGHLTLYAFQRPLRHCLTSGSPFLFLFQDPVSFLFSTYLRLYVSVVYYCLCSTRMSVLLRDAPLPDTVPGTYYIVNKLIKWNLFTGFKSSFCLFFQDQFEMLDLRDSSFFGIKRQASMFSNALTCPHFQPFYYDVECLESNMGFPQSKQRTRQTFHRYHTHSEMSFRIHQALNYLRVHLLRRSGRPSLVFGAHVVQ